MLRKLRKESSKAYDLLEFQQSTNKSLESLLIGPIQRIPRYELLLREIVKHSDAKEAGYADLVSALALVKKVANHMNDMIRAHENQEQIRELEVFSALVSRITTVNHKHIYTTPASLFKFPCISGPWTLFHSPGNPFSLLDRTLLKLFDVRRLYVTLSPHRGR